MRLCLVYDDWTLTEEGGFIKHLPVCPETGAMLGEAKRLDEQRMRDHGKPPRVMRDIVIIAAIAESHGLRKDTRCGHKSDQHRTSDMLDAMNAFRSLRKEPLAQTVLDATEAFLANASEEQLAKVQKDRLALEVQCLKFNISFSGFVEVARLADEITHRLGQHDKGIRVDARRDDDKYDAERYGELQRCILNANANRLFIYENDGVRDLLRDHGKRRNDVGQPFNGYEIGRSSIVPLPKSGTLLVGCLREVQPSKKDPLQPLIVLTDVTVVPPDVFLDWAVARAASNQAVVTNGSMEDGVLNAVYDGKACFDVPVSAQMRAKASHLLADPKEPQRSK